MSGAAPRRSGDSRLNDADFLQALRGGTLSAGQTEALLEFIARVIARVTTGGVRGADLEDCVQQCFRAVSRGAEAFEGRDGASLTTWIHSVVGPEAVRFLRKSRARGLTGLSATPDAAAPARVVSLDDLRHADCVRTHADGLASGGDAGYAEVEARSVVEAAFSLLTDTEERTLRLTLHHLEYRDIAALEGTTENAIRSRIAGARKKMRDYVAREVGWNV